MTHTGNISIGGSDLAAVIAAADAYVADSNAADFEGSPATSYRVFEVEGLYGKTYEASFILEYVVIAGTRFYSDVRVAA